MAEVWEFNEAGDVPEAARDDIDLQEGIVADTAVATTQVDGVTAQLPDGTTLDGFTSVDIDLNGTDLDGTLVLARLHWPSQPRDEAAETAKTLATTLDMETQPIDDWANQPRDGGSPISDGQGRNDTMGLRQVILEYVDVGGERASPIVTLYWPNEG